MKAPIVVCISIAAAGLSACGERVDKKAVDGGKVEQVRTMYTGPCQLGGNPPKVCSSVVVYRTATPHIAAVDPNTLEMPAGENNLRLYWQLPADCVFDTDQGDGVKLKPNVDGDNQFSEEKATEEHDHGAGGNGPQGVAKGHRYHWKNKNNDGVKTYDYVVQFRCGTDTTPWVADPTIKNQ
jgi:hypothetical protein